MPSLSDMRMVGQNCSAYEPEGADVERSCETCVYWGGEARDCILDIFWEQLTNLDQT
ncbi:MAG TPA: hypothetical protein PLM25_01360 [Limnochordia bacterium]|nr:hypothetical protein [Limnochordia bacterium]